MATATRRRRRQFKHIFCVEGDWWGDLKRPSTVRPVFELVAQMYPGLRDIHRCVGTREEFDHCLSTWAQRKYADYPVLYLAFHGSAGRLHVGDGRRARGIVELDEIAEQLSGRCAGRVIHFASCDTVDCDGRHLKRFMKVTGAMAVSGYRHAVDWIEAAAFEVLLLSELQQYTMTRRGLACARTRVQQAAGGLARGLGFRLEISPF